MGNNHVWRQRDQFGGARGMIVTGISVPADVDTQIATNSPAELRQFLEECPNSRLTFRILGRQHHANTAHPFALLCARRERPRRRAE